MRKLLWIGLLLLFVPSLMWAQSAVSGTVTDSSGAVVPNAKISLTDTAGGTTASQTSNSVGAYNFTGLNPGTYKMTVSASGFKNLTVPNVLVQVGKTSVLNAKLEVGQVTETVEVASTGQELQTVDASVGNVMNQQTLAALPSLSRDATALLQLQPMASPSYNQAPGKGNGDTTSGAVAGSRSDQNTFMVDGGDATSNTEADNNYVTGQGSPQAVVPTPVESIEEFRVTTNNSDTFARSAGANVQLATKRGGNSFHGAGWEYNQNTLYNANTWQLNHTGKDRGVWHDNRFGGRLGGPILKDRAYFFLMYEGRRFRKANSFERTLPSTDMRNGILHFGGVTYDFTPGCPSGCPNDPRGLGMSPLIQQFWQKYLPDPAKDFTPNIAEGDGRGNTVGYDGSVPIFSKENDGIARFDYKISSNWSLMASGRFDENDANSSSQVDIGGIATGSTFNVPRATRATPVFPRYYVLGLTGRLSANATNDFHINFLRHFWSWRSVRPFPQMPGLGAAMQVGAESSNAFMPMNIDTQNGRSRVWDGKDINLNDEVSWLKGSHLIQFGGSWRWQHFLHIRDDKVTGGLSQPEYYVRYSGTYNSWAAPAAIGSSDIGTYKNDVQTLLGMVSNTSEMLTRDGSLAPQAPGTPEYQRTNVDWADLHITDTWHLKPTFTLTYGLDWGVQTPAYEKNGLQTIMQYASTGQDVTVKNYFTNLVNAANAGSAYAPILQFTPVRTAHRKYPYKTDWHNFAPRLSMAWSPAFDESGLLGRIFGNQKSSIRAGYGRYFDRINGVGLVMTPALGIGFADLSGCTSPNTAAACATGKTDLTTGFRLGQDGLSLPVPPLTPVSGSIIPGSNAGVPGANSVYELIDFRIDPERLTGTEDTWTLSVQRQVNNSTMFEVGYVGRSGKHLYSTWDLNQVPYMMKLGGQTFADAYDALQKESNFGQNNPASYTPTPQPFFEAVGGTTAIYNKEWNGGSNGNLAIGDINTLFDNWVTGAAAAGGGNTMPLDQQVELQQITGNGGSSMYHALYASLRKQMTQGMMFQVNYTWAHSIDDIGLGQQYIAITPSDQFHPGKDKENSYFDRRHVVNGFFVYDLPFGPKRRFSSSSGVLNKIIGGWETSWSITASSGIPQGIYGDSCDELGAGYYANCATMVPTAKFHIQEKAHYNGDGSVNAYATGGTSKSAAGAAATLFQNGQFRLPLFSDKRLGGESITGLRRWNADASINKVTPITERVSIGLSLQAVNVFNHMEFNDAGAGLFSSKGSFGNLTSQFNSPRFLNIGVRLDF